MSDESLKFKLLMTCDNAAFEREIERLRSDVFR